MNGTIYECESYECQYQEWRLTGGAQCDRLIEDRSVPYEPYR